MARPHCSFYLPSTIHDIFLQYVDYKGESDDDVTPTSIAEEALEKLLSGEYHFVPPPHERIIGHLWMPLSPEMRDDLNIYRGDIKFGDILAGALPEFLSSKNHFLSTLDDATNHAFMDYIDTYAPNEVQLSNP
jgi:hypothetical protein